MNDVMTEIIRLRYNTKKGDQINFGSTLCTRSNAVPYRTQVGVVNETCFTNLLCDTG